MNIKPRIFQMKNLYLLIISLCFTQIAFACTETIVLEKGSVWKYMDDGSDQGTSWRNPSFNDSTWSSGPAELGYGDGDESTVVSYGPNPGDKFVTTYYRNTFTITDSSNILSASYWLKYDDGAVVYINGTEVARYNLPNGTIQFDTYANGSSEVSDAYTLDPTLLINGVNVITVEVHQANPTSSDLSFDLELSITEALVARGGSWHYLDDGSDQDTLWSQLGFDYSQWSSGNAQFGYGDGDEATVLDYGGDATNKHITYYFRKVVTVDSAGVTYGGIMNILFDDGAVVHLNGNEIFRSSTMPPGAILYNTTASGVSDEGTFVSHIINPGEFRYGTNVIGVEIHQANPTSSDISFDMDVCLLEANLPYLLRGPYVQMGTPTSMNIQYRTGYSVPTLVKYGETENNLTDIVSESKPAIDHNLQITGLQPDTKYFYAVESIYGEVLVSPSDSLFFITSPAIGSRDNYRFWVLGDCGTANVNQRAVRDAYYNYTDSQHTDLILLLGDNAYTSGTDSEYQYAMFEDMYEDIMQQTVAISCPGNHDLYTANSTNESGPYYDIFTLPSNAEAGGMSSGTEAYFSYDYGNVHIVSLDAQSYNSVGSPMLVWLENDLANTTQEWIIVIWHHPPYSKGSHNSDTEGTLIRMRENVVPICENAGADLILSGHSHSYERSKFVNGHYSYSSSFREKMVVVPGSGDPTTDAAYCKRTDGHFTGQGTIYAVAGSSGKVSAGGFNHPVMHYSTATLGSMVIDIHKDTLEGIFIDNLGNILDKFTIYKKPNDDLNYDQDNDGYVDVDECPTGWPCVDSDGDGIPDIRDDDSDADNQPDSLDNCRLGYEIVTKALLEGPLLINLGIMSNTINIPRGLLPGQTPLNGNATPTPAGQPYNQPPWNYTGTEGAGFTDADYTSEDVDWVLVSLRTSPAKSDQIWQAAALIDKSGAINLSNACLPLSHVSGQYYIVVEHKSHIAAMSHVTINQTDGAFTYDFTKQDSYSTGVASGQKEINNSYWVLFTGDIDQVNDPNGYDINGKDKFVWDMFNGVSDLYKPVDINLDGDVTGIDRLLWFKNNGVYSAVPK